jgi:3-phenylpropionate/cinnamic acid dioxygenase small subunit
MLAMPPDDPVEAIHRLIYRYAELLDAGDFAGVGALFADATYRAEVSPGKIHRHEGAAEVQALLERLVITYHDGTPRTKHVMTNMVVDVDGGVATSRTYFTVFQSVPPDLPLQPVIAGRYHDAFDVGPDGRWRFVDRMIYSDLFGEMTRHVRGFDRL